MSQFTVGKDVLSYCSKCKLNLAHTIVSMKDDNNIAKVKCNTCKTIHAYKDPSKASAKKKVRRKSERSKAIPVADLWMEQLSQATEKSQVYKISEKFKVGDVIDHKKFGPGIVQEVVDDKINVIFRHEIKTLVHNK